jgi:hypothetical protein
MTRTLIALAVFAVATPARGEELESALLDRAKGIIKFCQGKPYQTVGVLKFLGAKQGGGVSDNLGTVNSLLARRLEVALVLANDPRRPINLIDNASAVAARTPAANHYTAAGRKALFAAQYKLAWGDPRVRATPDAFVTGLVHVSKDLKTLSISLFCFDRTTSKLEAMPGVPDAVVANRPANLVELGESFTVRGAFDDGKVETKAKPKNDTPAKPQAKNDPPADLPKDKGPDQAELQSAVDARDQKAAKHPAEDPNSPI